MQSKSVGENVRHVSFSVVQEELAGRLYAPLFEMGAERKTFPGVVIYPGRKGNRKPYWRMARDLVASGMVVLAFDFRGCGKSQGAITKQTIAGGLDDALAGYDFLAQQAHVNKDQIAIVGSSYGAYLGAIVSGKRRVKALVLSAPAMYDDAWWDDVVEDISDADKRRYRAAGQFSNTRALNSIYDYEGDLLIVRHELDEQMPPTIADSYYRSAVHVGSRELQTLQGVGHAHTTEESRQRFEAIAIPWLTKILAI